MLNKIKMMVVVLVCMVVVGSIASTVAAVDIASKEAAVAEVKAEIAKVDEEEAEIVERLEAGYESDDIEASVEVVDLSSTYRFIYGISVDYAIDEGIEDNSIVYCINYAGNSDYCLVRYNSESNMVDFKTIEDLEEEVSSDKFLIIQLAIFTIAMGAMAIMVLFTIIDNKAEEAEFKAHLAKKEAARKERDTAEAIELVKEAVSLAETIESNDMRTYYLDDLYSDIDQLIYCIKLDIVDYRDIHNIKRSMKLAAESAYFIF